MVKANFSRQNLTGFTLLEIIVSVSLFIIIILLVGDIFLLTQRAYEKNSSLAELTQNVRVSLDRLSRELRQSAAIVTSLPPSDDDPLNPPAGQIFFQDGHDASQITYLRYYLDGADLMREHKAYYFDQEPSVYVTYNSVDQGGSPPRERDLGTNIVGEYFTNLKFWGANGLINLSVSLAKNQNDFSLTTAVFSRNH